MANRFNKFFCNSASTLDSELPVGNGHFSFQKVSEKEVLKIIDSIAMGKATGWDNIGAHFIRDGASNLV